MNLELEKLIKYLEKLDRDMEREKVMSAAFVVLATGWVGFTLYVVAVCRTSHLHW